ncbi:uncharacterized protein BDR25DRAFT_55676 [Lindgomyces ingoldianus]|uniref:Uncharacterized protein n=1 Tax=Lindgomyces ingoldianus TaxID=673940 RepID=A0ACB6QND8_9PLEO|nr:uncharacterized protein BDR25DRAFT_55676 [Lindgomyces ingoldianus]KAF2468529.1 hypothetical protein BDR25DRAFT_55676 [Lindgomyces ingoldianus]
MSVAGPWRTMHGDVSGDDLLGAGGSGSLRLACVTADLVPVTSLPFCHFTTPSPDCLCACPLHYSANKTSFVCYRCFCETLWTPLQLLPAPTPPTPPHRPPPIASKPPPPPPQPTSRYRLSRDPYLLRPPSPVNTQRSRRAFTPPAEANLSTRCN